MRKFNLIYIGFISILLLFITYFYLNIGKYEQQVKDNIKQVIFKNTSYFIDNIIEMIDNEVKGDLYSVLKNNEKLRKELEKRMEILINPSFKYVYMLYRDKEGKYRYLLDGSKDDKGLFDEKFDVNKEEWDKVYDTKKPTVIFQNNFSGLWVTTLKPYIQNNRVVGVVAMDFSTTLLGYLSKTLEPLKNLFFYIFIAAIFLFSVILYQIILQLRTKKESVTDPLTGAYNRVFLREFVKKINYYSYDVAMIDLDHFKKVNDNYGHKAGDYILQGFVKIVKSSLRQKDVLIRFGGEEFLLFLHRDKNKQSKAKEVLERIRKKIEEYDFKFDGEDIKSTISIGLVTDIYTYRDIQEVIKKADERLYIAKHSGRNRVVYKEQISNSTNRLSISQIKSAIDENRILCQYQPIVEVDSKKVVKFEALIRLIDKDGKIIYPNSFIDTIENTNIYRDMTKKLLSIVFEKIKESNTSVSMNLNLSDIVDNAIYETIYNEIKMHKNLANFLTLELLEYELLDSEILYDRLKTIKEYGVKIALDDFGSGYSNFAIFKTLPIDILKIDGGLIKNIHELEISHKVVEAITFLAYNLELEVVAEFVHNKEVLDKISELNIKYAQGFYLGKPS